MVIFVLSTGPYYSQVYSTKTNDFHYLKGVLTVTNIYGGPCWYETPLGSRDARIDYDGDETLVRLYGKGSPFSTSFDNQRQCEYSDSLSGCPNRSYKHMFVDLCNITNPSKEYPSTISRLKFRVLRVSTNPKVTFPGLWYSNHFNISLHHQVLFYSWVTSLTNSRTNS